MKQKYKIDTKAFFELYSNLLKYLAIFFLSLIVCLGYTMYRKLVDPTSFQAWTFLGIIILCMVLLIWIFLDWKYSGLFWIPTGIVIVGVLGNILILFKISLWILVIIFIYELLKIFGLEIKGRMKLYWRGRKLK